jgi:hypothetical protein
MAAACKKPFGPRRRESRPQKQAAEQKRDSAFEHMYHSFKLLYYQYT